MATTGILNTTSLRVYVGGTAVAHATDASISFSMSPRDVTTKDSGGYRELLEGLRQFSLSTSALYAMDAAYGVDDLYTALDDRTQITVRFSTEESGDDYFEGTCYCTSLEISSSGAEDNASYSASFEGTGEPTTTAVT